MSLSDEGRPVVRGELLGHDGRYFRILGPHGEVTLDGTGLACTGAACPAPDAPETVRISGEAAILDGVLPALLETYATRRGLSLSATEAEGGRRIYSFADADGTVAGRVDLHATTSAEGAADIIADAADLAVLVRPLSPRELSLAAAAGRGDLSRPGRAAILGLDAVVPVVSLRNPADRIGVADLHAVLAGRIDNWSDLGGPDAPISLHLPDPRTGAGEAIAALLPRPWDGTGAQIHDSRAALAEAVAGDRQALGITLLSAAGPAQPLTLTGSCGVKSEAGPLPVKTEDYPLTRPVFLVAPARRIAPFARSLVDYVTSPVAQPVIRRSGLIDQFPEAIPFAVQGDRLGLAILSAEDERALSGLRRMVEDLSSGVRLSVSFRFENGSTDLDAQSASNVALLAEALDRGLFEGREIIFAGFSDGQGAPAANRLLSRRRAETVRDAVAARIGDAEVRLSVAAYGEALPMACDDTAWGREINRRVEVWLD